MSERDEQIAEAGRVRDIARDAHVAAIAVYDAEMARINEEYPA